MNSTLISATWISALAGCVLVAAPAAPARDRIRIPLPPPPSQVIQDVRDIIHGIGRGIRRVGTRIVDSVEAVELRRTYPDYAPLHEDEDGDWDGEFYPDHRDTALQHEEFMRAPRSREEQALWEEHLRREEQYRRAQEQQQQQRYRDADEEEDEGYLVPAPMPPGSSPVPPEHFHAPSPQPSPGVKDSTKPAPAPPPSPTFTPGPGPATTPPSSPAPPPVSSNNKPAAPSQVQYGSPVPGKKGLVYPPGVEKKPENMVDVSDFQPGQLVRDPKTGALFRVP